MQPSAWTRRRLLSSPQIVCPPCRRSLGATLGRHLRSLVLCNNVRKTREGWNCEFQKTPHTEGGDKVPAVWTEGSRRVAFPGARNPRICSISRFGKIFPAIFPGFSSRTPEQTPETATAFSSFLKQWRFEIAAIRIKIQDGKNSLKIECLGRIFHASRYPWPQP